jgi:plastocyanin domain-containing protein
MNMGDIIVVVTAVAALGGLGWFFFGPRKATAAELAGGVQRAAVTVRGGYTPEALRVRDARRQWARRPHGKPRPATPRASRDACRRGRS